jgi:chromate transporter
VEQSSAAQPRISLIELYWVFTYIGLMSFGGGLIPWIQREVVFKRRWLENEDFFPGVALSQVLPGVNSTNLAVFIGNKTRGLPGALVSLAGILSAPFLVMIVAVSFYHLIAGVRPVQIAMAGIAAAAIGMIMRTGFMAVQASWTTYISIGIFIVTFIAIGILRLPLIWTVAIITPISIAASWPRGDDGPPDGMAKPSGEEGKPGV